jgi:hypothetical protein
VIESSPKPCDIGLTSVVGPVGRLIALGELLNGSGFTTYEHAFLVLPDEQLIEAQPGGAVVRPLADYAGRHVTFVVPGGLADDQRAAVCAAALKYVGVGYSAAEYFAIAAHRFHLPVPFLRQYIGSSRRMICSQLVDQCYADAGVPLFCDLRWSGYVTPADLGRSLGAGGEQR